MFGDITNRLPEDPSGNRDFIFHSGSVPAPPGRMATDRIVLRKGFHDYNSWYRTDALWMYLGAKKCRELGVFLLACAFHGPSETTTLELIHSDSDIRRIMVPAGRLTLDDAPNGLSTIPFAFRYWPTETKRHPWMYDCGVDTLPILALSNEEDSVGPSEEEWRARDTVRIPATLPGTIRLAELLLNAGCAWNTVRDYALEGDAGYRSVGPMSAELRIFLPGSDGWGYESDDIGDASQTSR